MSKRRRVEALGLEGRSRSKASSVEVVVQESKGRSCGVKDEEAGGRGMLACFKERTDFFYPFFC